MASPFSMFRRYQRTMLVIACVGAMLAFVVGDPISRYLGHAGGSENPVVVTANSHSYRASELIALVQSRSVVKNFLQRLAIEWVQKMAEAQKIPGQRIAAIAQNVADNWRQELMDRALPPEIIPSEDEGAARQSALSEEEAAAIQTVVLAAAAEEHGMVVTDQVVNDYLQSITQNLVSPAEFEAVVSSLHADTRNMSQAFLFDSLRRELLASRYSFMYRVSLASVLPAQRWEYFQQLNRKAEAEVLGVAVEPFLKDVPEPSDADLKALFEKYREVLPTPNSPIPGFKRPTKAKFQYFLANYGDFTDRAMKEVTSEEISAYYEKNKDIRYRERKGPGPGDADDMKSGDTPAEGAPSSDAAPGDSGSAPAAGTDNPKGADQPQKPAAEDPKKPAAGSTPPAAPAAGDKKSSRSVPASALHLVALAQKPDEKTPAAKTPDAKTPAAAPAADAKRADAKPAAATTDEKPATDDKPAADATDEKSTAPADAAADNAGTKSDVTYEPLVKVEDEIRKTLAAEKANRLITEAFQRLTTKMREYRSARGEYEVRKEEEPDLEEPDPLDLPALASAEGLEAKETDLVSADELYDATDLGKSFNDDTPDRRSLTYRRVPFPLIGFPDRLFSPEITEDIEGNGYLSWKIKETPEGVPEFDEVRKEVIRAFKLIEARKLAVGFAQGLAKEARKAEKPLSEIFDGREGLEKVVETGPFTWMTIGNVAFDPGANQPRLSAVHGVESPGDEFMEAVFNSTPGQVSVAPNEPKTVVYVIQVKGFEPPTLDLRHEFLLEDFRKYARLAMNDEQTQYVQWLRWLDRQAGVTWLKPGYTSRRSTD
jgi:hypothetical protein